MVVFDGYSEDPSTKYATHKWRGLLHAGSTVHVSANQNPTRPTILVADDIDILILLCWHVKPSTPATYARPEPRQCAKRTPRWSTVAVMWTVLGPKVCDYILFVHVILRSEFSVRYWEEDKFQVDKHKHTFHSVNTGVRQPKQHMCICGYWWRKSITSNIQSSPWWHIEFPEISTVLPEYR